MIEPTPIKIADMLARIADWAVENNTVDGVLFAIKKQLLESALAAENGNQCHTARRLGVHRNTLHRTMRQLGIPTKGKISKHGRRPA